MVSRPSAVQIENWTKLFQLWASLGSVFQRSQSRPRFELGAGKAHDRCRAKSLKGNKKRLCDFLQESTLRFEPLEDPFDVDLGLHRWLEAEREEGYSDWLEWVVRQTPNPQVFELFGLAPPEGLLDYPQCEPWRELCVPYGHVDQEGRLDLVIPFADKATIIVEVKLGSADDADIEKHRGYNRSIEELKYPNPYRVLLATSEEEEDYEGFSFCSWATVCLEMRRLALSLKANRRMTVAAMVLAFVAAVEQNLLGFSSRIVREIREGNRIWFNVEVVDHIERFLKRLE